MAGSRHRTRVLPAETGGIRAANLPRMTETMTTQKWPVTTMTEGGARELAYRACDGLEVTLFWSPLTDDLRVCVCDQNRGAYFEIRPERHLALDVFYHPYSYASSSDVHYEDDRLAA